MRAAYCTARFSHPRLLQTSLKSGNIVTVTSTSSDTLSQSGDVSRFPKSHPTPTDFAASYIIVLFIYKPIVTEISARFHYVGKIIFSPPKPEVCYINQHMNKSSCREAQSGLKHTFPNNSCNRLVL